MTGCGWLTNLRHLMVLAGIDPLLKVAIQHTIEHFNLFCGELGLIDLTPVISLEHGLIYFR